LSAFVRIWAIPLPLRADGLYGLNQLIDIRRRCRRNCSSRWAKSLRSTATSTMTGSTAANWPVDAAWFLPTSSARLPPLTPRRRDLGTLAVLPARCRRRRRCPMTGRWFTGRRVSPRLLRSAASCRLPSPQRPGRPRPSSNRCALATRHSRSSQSSVRRPRSRRRLSHVTSPSCRRRRTSPDRPKLSTSECDGPDNWLSADEGPRVSHGSTIPVGEMEASYHRQ